MARHDDTLDEHLWFGMDFIRMSQSAALEWIEMLRGSNIDRAPLLVIHINISGPDKDSYKYSFYHRTIIQWNLLPIHIHEAATVDAFKALIPGTVLTPIYHV